MAELSCYVCHKTSKSKVATGFESRSFSQGLLILNYCCAVRSHLVTFVFCHDSSLLFVTFCD